MSSLEHVTDGHTEALQQARNMAQMELAKESGQDLITWIGEHANDFGELVVENPAILERLAQEATNHDALEEVKKEIYH
jgi:hypothetical protein